jgi:hypothetical protein
VENARLVAVALLPIVVVVVLAWVVIKLVKRR